MRRMLLDSIKGHELLAKDILSDSGIVIMSAGSVIKREYVKRLMELGIYYIYVNDELSVGLDDEDSIEEKIKDQCQDIVKEIIDKYSYQGNGDLVEIQSVAEQIMSDIIEEPEVMFSISGVRRKSESTYSHSINVCALSVLLALRLRLPKVKVKEIAIGSLLHDIGYNLMPFDYMDFNYIKSSKQEQKELMKHVILGYSSVVKEDWLSLGAKDIILCHHERLDGTGYPFHKKEDKIKIGSKIVAVCDVFDSFVYGFLVPKMKVHHTIDYIVSQAGVKFDFDIVNCFIEAVAAYPNGTVVVTNRGEKGIVIRQNIKCPTRPVLHMISDANGNKYQTWIEKDLKKELSIMIEDTIEL
ncbi:c-di-GMP phosphodiesterase [Anaerocolumna cellulosilytica]|uniref:C-di-GMP phosphodiesterase n=1 Tax=Anaerocolumna cellulosilytica TaxID=433286 RepID=A0A6S6R1Z4_9FIRM|nr:HD domain-containing phosphohydrolase [Anaerocolumna cellulosilytica]MBB5195933.1 HD-GYP domain-containing protein (c-di-GMP phosphodiesterase class II) [Anaerocolumna cellulosilytica]BCJ96944.1 c-di-GMP phosphodiesterase [Anaerocolumna cellulosilytica]